MSVVGAKLVFARFRLRPDCRGEPCVHPCRLREQHRANTRFPYGTFLSNSSTHTSGPLSLGARQSLLGESDPPDPTLGPLGIAERLNWLVPKNLCRKTRSHFLITGSSYCRQSACG